MEQNTCQSCEHFFLHYVKSPNGNFYPTAGGHCVKPRLKKRFSDDPACPHWEEKINT